MDSKIPKTYAISAHDITRDWWIVDADGLTLGRLASRIAHVLRGKHKAVFSTHIDTGDYVIVVNAEKVRTTANRLETKVYHHSSGYPSGLTSIRLKEQLQRFPERPIRLAVKGMLPKNALGHQMMGKLKIYAGPSHPHDAQQPRPFRELFKNEAW
jgi:large subunit ribosomal protein L13